MMLHNEILTFVLLTLIAIGDIIWIATDPRPHNNRRQRKISLTYPRVTFALLPQIGIALLWPWPSTSLDAFFVVSGTALLVAGLGLALWTRAIMGHVWAPPDSHDINRQDRLITNGPFAFSRNPIYVGVCLIVLGFAIATRSWGLILVVPLFISLRNSVLREEKALSHHFGAHYQRYKASVPRFLLYR